MREVVGRVIVVAVAALLHCSSLGAQEKLTLTVPYRGVQVFANLLHEEGLKPLAEIAALKDADPARTLIVVLGRPQPIDEIEETFGMLPEFLRAGGALLIASDYPASGRLKSISVDISGFPVYQAARLAFLGQYEHCPVLSHRVAPPHPLRRDLTLPLVTNRPTWMARYPGGAEVIATFGPGCFSPRGGFPVPEGSPCVIASRADATPAGRFVVAGGHGLFMNFALVSQEHGNFVFARNVARWLAEGPRGKRTQVLLIEQETVTRRLDLPLNVPPIPWGPLLNTFMDQVDRQGLVEEFVRRNIRPTTLWALILLSLTSILLPLALRRLVLSRFRRDVKTALAVGLADAPPPPLSMRRQRETDLWRRGNLAEPARVLARQWLREAGAEYAPRWEIAASWWRRSRLDRHLQWIARLAGYEPVDAVTVRQFRRLAETLSALSRARRNGEFRFLSPPHSPKNDETQRPSA